jgi:ATP-binding cassette, subfamily B, bacterial
VSRALGSGVRATARTLWAATRLAGSAAPATLSGYAVLTLLAGAGPVFAASLLRRLIDDLGAPQPRHAEASVTVAVLAVVGMLVALVPPTRAFLHNRLLRAVGMRAMDRLYRATARLQGIASMEDPAFRDRLRMAQQSGRAGPGQLMDDALGTVESAITLCGFVALLLAINPWIAAAVLATGGPALFVQLRLNRVRAAMLWGISARVRREAHYAELLTNLAAAKEVRLLGLSDLFRARMVQEMTVANAAQSGQDVRELRSHAALAVVGAAMGGGALIWAISSANAATLSVGDVALVVAAVASVQAATSTVVSRIGSAHQAIVLFGHYRDIERSPSDLVISASPAVAPPLRAGIELRNVWFRYAWDKPWVLRGVNLTIPHGRAVALVGLNGAGKSTLIKLLCRFYDPTCGSITWDGTDIRALDVVALRDRIGAVFQDYMAYELSAHENVSLGDLAAMGDRERVVGAASRAGAHDIITSLPNGYDTLLSNAYYDEADRDDPRTGVLLSGGQWQRLALARAFMRDDRDLMILDEPSAGLDAEAEYDLNQRLRRHRSGRTSVLISHRLGSVRDSDMIVVLAKGRVVECGTHEELLAAAAGYARLFRLQANGYQHARGDEVAELAEVG